MLYFLLFTTFIQNVSNRRDPIVMLCTKISAFRFVKLMESQSFPFVHNFAPIRSSFWQIFNGRQNFANPLQNTPFSSVFRRISSTFSAFFISDIFRFRLTSQNHLPPHSLVIFHKTSKTNCCKLQFFC